MQFYDNFETKIHEALLIKKHNSGLNRHYVTVFMCTYFLVRSNQERTIFWIQNLLRKT